mmetsp:Transcript_36738/g.118081  ORF Transcript_36738/g.118081 Transcript_36738/m.118081 type:complete len:294 (+) Transcript_36738:1109-1990(+)
MKPGFRSHSPAAAHTSQLPTSGRSAHGGWRGSSSSHGADSAGSSSFHRTLMSAALSPALNRSSAVWPSDRSLRHTCTSASPDAHQTGVPPAVTAGPRKTRRACLAPASWLMASSSGEVRSRRSRLRIIRGSFPSMSGAESMHQKAKCVRCSVRVRPPTEPHSSRDTYCPLRHEPSGRWSGHASTRPYGVIPLSPTSNMSGSLYPQRPCASQPEPETYSGPACCSIAVETDWRKPGSFRTERAVCSSQTENRSRPVRHEFPTCWPHRCGAPVPQLQMERRIGRPVALSASRIRS